MSQVQYPSVVSRTLNPVGLSLSHVTGLHDKKLADSDLNLMQDIADLKRTRQLADTTCSGVLSYAPFTFLPSTALCFSIPAFDALINGELITVGGNASADLTQNLVYVPPPQFWTPGSTQPQAQIYVVFLEAWYQRLDPTSGTGFYVNPTTGIQYYSANGCVNPVLANLIPSDVVDPFMGTETTERVQVQWGIRIQPVALSYDFTKYDFGLDPGAIATEIVYGQGNQATSSSTAPYQFSKMGPINGDAGLWRAGDGNVNNELGSMDGYTYALPLAVVFQRNTGVFLIDQNPFGSASATTAGSGLLASGISGRYDAMFADVVYSEDTVDTRSIVGLKGFDDNLLMRHGFVDLITGKTRQAIGRGETPGSQTLALGSQLAYSVAVNAKAVANTDTVGAFDGFMNGFSSQDTTYTTTKTVTVNQKTVGTIGGRWQQNDAFVLALPAGSSATIASVQVQGVVSNSVASTKTPVLFLQGQIAVTGIGTSTITVTIAKNLVGTSYDPGLNPIYLTLGVEYPAGGGLDLRQIPSNVYGGSLLDGASGVTLPVYGVSEYDVQTTIPTPTALSAIAINPEYSNTIFGTRVTIAVLGSTGVSSTNATGNTITTFAIQRTGLNATWEGIYVLSAADQASGSVYTIASRSITGGNFTLQIAGAVATTSTMLVTFLVADTAQLAYNAPVKGVTSIEETVLAGNLNTTGFRMDNRIQVLSVQNNPGSSNTVVLATTDALLSGIAGDDVNKIIWVQDISGNLDAVQISSAVFSNGFVTLTVPSSVNLEVQPFFVVAALRPAFPSTSSLMLTEYYIPYQGEGKLLRDYEMVYTENMALVTTNGTGAAPVPGLSDVYPYNRELPIITTLPSQVAWNDSGLANAPVASFFDSNYEAKRFQNVEHTFEVPIHTNDFIEPVHDDKRKTFQLTVAGGGRGYSKAIPHLGYAIRPMTSRTVLGSNVMTTAAPVTLFVNNVLGSDNNDGLTTATALKTIAAAVNALPSVLRHPCTIQLISNGTAYSISNNQSTLEVIALGDGDLRPLKYYALANIAFTIQDAGRLVITRQAGTSALVTIDATGFAGFGDGPTSAFFIDDTRVLFNGIEFKGFFDSAINGMDSDVEFIDCQFTNNLTAGSFMQGSSVLLDGGAIVLADGGTGMILSASAMEASDTQLTVAAGATPGIFFVAERGSSLTLQTHSPLLETNVTAQTVIAEAQLNSSITVAKDFSSLGSAILEANSVLSRTVVVSPFAGGVSADTSSSVNSSLN